MSEALGEQDLRQGTRPPITVIYLRVVAMLLLLVGLARACQILGIVPEGHRFEDLTPAMRAGATALLLVDIMASVGLWIGAVWGPVMWALALAVEVLMYTFFADTFGSYPLRVMIHVMFFLGFLALIVVEWQRAQD